MKVKSKTAENRIQKEDISSRFSITAKITLWYTLFLVIIAVMLTLILVRVHDERTKTAAENKLVKVVEEVSHSIEADGKDFILDKKIQFYYKDTYISVYELDGELYTGRRPRGIDVFPELNIEKIQTMEDASGGEWFCYDNVIDVDGKDMYIRGMLNSITESDNHLFAMSLVTGILPVIIILAAIGGYLITKGAFGPVREIIRTTEEISEDGDLSRRIPLGKSHDEIYELSESFNEMFDRVEDLVNREKQFTADVSHELRTPLAVIHAQSEFAMEDESYAPKAVGIINQESRKMSELISNLLMIARSDAGRIEPEIEEVNVSELLQEIAEIKTPSAEEVGQRIETNIEEGISIETDEDMLARIIINLVDNAIKYGKRPEGRVLISACTRGGDVVCRVSDDGTGIGAEDREKIWERFYRTDGARTSGDSTGLGLAIVGALAKALGAEVELLEERDSELGGASFELRIKGKKK